jgi:hypothetical protein
MSEQNDLISQAITAHQEAIKSSKGSLPHAIKAGECLILLKENVKAEKSGRWLDWLANHCPDIPERTARVYMELAEGKDEIKKRQRAADNLAADGKLTIRSALKLLKPSKTPEQIEKTKAVRAQKRAEAKRSPDAIKEFLNWCAADELFFVMQHTWEEEQIKTLAGLIADYLKAKPTTMPDIPAAFDRRPLATTA